MQGLEKHLEKEKSKPINAVQDTKTIKGVRGDIDDEDDEESYYRYLSILPKFKLKKSLEYNRVPGVTIFSLSSLSEK